MRWFVVAWVALALAATATLGVAGAKVGRWPEEAHLFGHLVLCGGLAFGVATAAPGTAHQRAAWAVGAGLGFGLAIEVVQARFHPVWAEAGFDLCMDALGAVAGMLLWGRLQQGPAHVASAVLHPLIVAPIGLVMAVGPGWTMLCGACLAPAVGLWLAGLHAGWWSDADVSTRTQRGPLFAVGCASVAALVVASWDTPRQDLALAMAAAAALGTALTAGGLKVSGHVAIPAVLGLWLGPERAGQWLLGTALLLTWARWVSGRHQALEVAAAWGLAAGVMMA